MDQPAQKGSIVPKRASLPRLTGLSGGQFFRFLVFSTVIILLVVVFFGFFRVKITFERLENNRDKTHQPVSTLVNKPKQNESTNLTAINLNYNIRGRVVRIDDIKRIVTLESLDEAKKVYRLEIPIDVKIMRPAPGGVGGQSSKNNVSFIAQKFEDIRIGSVLGILSKEDPKLTPDLTAVGVQLLV